MNTEETSETNCVIVKTSDPPAPSPESNAESLPAVLPFEDCVVCLEFPANTRLTPCNHQVLCLECLSKIEESCPICRVTITEFDLWTQETAIVCRTFPIGLVHSGLSSSCSLGDIYRGVWKLLLVQGSFPPAMSSHTLTSLDNGSFLVRFGGSDGRIRTNEVWLFDTKDRQWMNFQPSGPQPIARAGHSAVNIDEKIYMFGGRTEEGRSDELFYLDCTSDPVTWVWPNPTGARPATRTRHSAVVWRDKMYIFGGRSGLHLLGFENFNDLFEYDPETNHWSAVHPLGEVPTQRAGHTAIVDHATDTMYTFGGSYDGMRYYNDTYAYHFPTQTWRRLDTQGIAPVPRDSHVAFLFGGGMYIYGGETLSRTVRHDLFRLDLNSYQWVQVDAASVNFSPIHCADASLTPLRPGSREIFFHCGCSGFTESHAMYRLLLQDMTVPGAQGMSETGSPLEPTVYDSNGRISPLIYNHHIFEDDVEADRQAQGDAHAQGRPRRRRRRALSLRVSRMLKVIKTWRERFRPSQSASQTDVADEIEVNNALSFTTPAFPVY
eukprot:TRINITY_DN18605_c0_g1::TRINITY_DN18605_c0_g1_i1::g.1038::m.1038 TRINITY_DN18605_c0_g1::TRINITY_DN18605_c0_g1_i1::g.1038  ORF type:complete len:549 (+),score=27.81,sp/P87061/TEA1_SCHPO/32.26/1e-30,sp/P87061/TEA1_SCHPO/30.28/3e-25,Kelch_4/PF13418.1/9e-06,Kelch_4/PF13418.1/2.3e-06,Kelch_4/PF13418.1/3.3e-10,Kelch_4/PF13418.1/3.8e-10,Kelch_4/PF13418.1/8e-05,Kelch_3/PF13415.1/71,Kelch_3/PF13415.1/1.1e-06,Kelch_3/PF13415.1/1.3,Kelch_3/PF13415.1/3.5e-08,Kelch_3/PF13415.1/4.4e-06,Kelch_3/PF13415.1/0.0013